MVHESKSDAWLVALVAAGAVLPFALAVWQWREGAPLPPIAILVASGLFVVGVVRGFAWPVQYEIRPPQLAIRAGLLRWELQLEAIESVRPSRNPLSAPAWSLDRLRIDYRAGAQTKYALISPRDAAGFVRELCAAVPGLEPTGDRRARRSATL
ncbi:MAG: PH domain-containing protein [Myxococcota bacterium]|nr:PH domain-containing protein [Myxococcota bacterium]